MEECQQILTPASRFRRPPSTRWGHGAGTLCRQVTGRLRFRVARCALGVATLSATTNWRQLYGVAVVAGIGFTVSLFIAGLVFSNPETFHGVRLSFMVGSIVSAIGGGAVLWSAYRQRLNAVPKEVEPFP